jgi:hypothetical protein
VSNRYPVIDVSSATRDLIEPMGTKRKFWFSDADGARWLFKYSRPQTGEHWAEKIAAEIGVRLGIPIARVELGMCDGALGACSQSFLPAESALVHGNELLQEVDQTYPVTQLRGVSKHTVEAVFGQLLTVDPPIGSPATLSAADCFVGYLLLDALIGNGDRHHENWAVIHDTSSRRLAPSYDHASSLGRELLDEARAARLDGSDQSRTVDRYAGRATSAFYAISADLKPLSPIDAFRTAARLRPAASAFWLARLADVGQDVIENIVFAVPSEFMTDLARRFALAVTAWWRPRLLRVSG